MKQNKLHIISHKLCPYVQRSIVVLLEKGIIYERTDIDLNKKPNWFLSMSPMGKVPALQVNQNKVLFESAVICEYIDEITPNSLHPDDPFEKAHHRSWIEFGSETLNSISKLYNAKDKDTFEVYSREIQKKIQLLEQQVKGETFFSGDKLQIIDATYGPIFRYFDVFEKIIDLTIFANVPKVENWRKHLTENTSIKNAVSLDYHDLLLQFLKNRKSYISQFV